MTSLKEIFEEDPYSYPESIMYQDGIYDYIEDVCWKQNPAKCSGIDRENIEKILKSHPSQQRIISPFLEFELANGKGSSRLQRSQNMERLQSPTVMDKLDKIKSLNF